MPILKRYETICQDTYPDFVLFGPNMSPYPDEWHTSNVVVFSPVSPVAVSGKASASSSRSISASSGSEAVLETMRTWSRFLGDGRTHNVIVKCISILYVVMLSWIWKAQWDGITYN